jgi:hypothetical protein
VTEQHPEVSVEEFHRRVEQAHEEIGALLDEYRRQAEQGAEPDQAD